ncbi:MAG: carbohydrate ABC transporter permease [Brevinema sp.]
MKKTNPALQYRDTITAYILLLPFMVIFILFILQPMLGAVAMSFQTGTFNKLSFAGLTNYKKIFQDPLVLQALTNTFLFVLTSTLIYIAVAVLFALWSQHPRGISTMLRISFYVPTVLIISIMTNLWFLMFRPELGLWASMTRGTPLEFWNWIRDVNLARWTIILSTLWWTVGTNMLIVITSLRAISKDIYEAAELDGVTPIQNFFFITLPQLWPTLGILTILQVISSFKLFGQPLLITKGGPDHMTRSIVQYIYDLGFQARNPGYAAAISVLLMALLIIFTLIQMTFGKKQS